MLARAIPASTARDAILRPFNLDQHITSAQRGASCTSIKVAPKINGA
jgi:hypothetical protein